MPIAKDGLKVCSKAGCIHQGQPQPLDNFRADSDRTDGKMSQCKDCMRLHAERYKQDGRRKASLDKYTKTDTFKANLKRYAKSEKGKATAKKFRQTEKGRAIAKRQDKKNAARYNTDHEYRQKVLARARVTYNVKVGKILPASSYNCNQCDRQAQEYHHYLGYDREHSLDIIPLCVQCHRNIEPIK